MLQPVIYTMGRVGSTSVSTAIEDAGIAAIAIHTLDRGRLIDHSMRRLHDGHYPPTHVCISMLHNNKIRQKASCLYITLVREPIARNFSAYFHNFPPESKLYAGDRKDPKKVYNDFFHHYQHGIPLEWLEREFGRELGIDVYKSDFDKERKYVHLEGSNTLIIRVDCPDEVKSDVISEILGRRVTVGRKNDSANSSYANLYRSVMEIASLPHEFVEGMYTSKYARHFWSDIELSEFSRKWTNDRTTTDLPSTVQSSFAA